MVNRVKGLVAVLATGLLILLLNGIPGMTQDHQAANKSSDSSGRPFERSGLTSASEVVVLGSPELTMGLPGEGPLSVEEIKTWLADPHQHKPLELRLPLGLNVLPNRLAKLKTPLTRAKIELGRQLFFDARLSADGSVSCASCHDPDHGYTVPTRFATGIGGQIGKRNPPTLYNRVMFGGMDEEEFWDGHAATIEDAVLIAMTDPTEMGNSLEQLIKTLRRIEGYRIQFETIYEAVTVASIGDAVGSFVRTLVTGASAFDYHRALEPYHDDDIPMLRDNWPKLYDHYKELRAGAEKHPMSESALRGMEIYFSEKATCKHCHRTPALTDNKFHNIGIGWEDGDPDLGRYWVTGDDHDRGAFKTPPVRNAALTAPYMHDGSLQTLEEVVAWYAEGNRENPYLDSAFVRLGPLSAQDQKDLVEFMKSCTGELPPVQRGRLPE